jgi:uncharacterized protein
VRAVLDPNILIAALLSAGGAPARLLSRWGVGDFELVASNQLLDELRRALAYPKLRRHVTAAEADAFVALLAQKAVLAEQPKAGTHHSADAGDDYLLALAESERAVLVSGDQHLLVLADDLPIQTAREFLETLERRSS